MNKETIRCGCTNCPGAACTCGCQRPANAELAVSQMPRCGCGAMCQCDASESGCLCA